MGTGENAVGQPDEDEAIEEVINHANPLSEMVVAAIVRMFLKVDHILPSLHCSSAFIC